MILYKDIMHYIDEFILVYNWNLSILGSLLKNRMPQKFAIANFGHPVSQSWLRPCIVSHTEPLSHASLNSETQNNNTGAKLQTESSHNLAHFNLKGLAYLIPKAPPIEHGLVPGGRQNKQWLIMVNGY